MSKVRYGVIGIGKMGSQHAKRLLLGQDKNATLTAVADTNATRRDWAESNLKNVSIFDNAEDLINCKEVDAVIIATPHYDHPKLGIKALQAGKHILVEKPIGVYTKAVKELYEEAKKHPELTFGIMYNQRTDPMYKKAKEIIESGELGEIKRINWVITNWYRPQAYYDQGGWRGTWEGEGGGVLINQCPHQLDLFQWLGGMPTKVYGKARVGVGRNINVENDVTFMTEYENGAVGVFVTSTHDFPGTNRLQIDGDGGQIVVEWTGLLTEKLTYTKLNTKESEFNKTNKVFMPRIPNKKVVKKIGLIGNAFNLGIIGQHIKIIRNFSEAVLFGKELIAPGMDGINGLTLSNAVYLSSWLDKEITLPLDEELFLSELQKRIDSEKKA